MATYPLPENLGIGVYFLMGLEISWDTSLWIYFFSCFCVFLFFLENCMKDPSFCDNFLIFRGLPARSRRSTAKENWSWRIRWTIPTITCGWRFSSASASPFCCSGWGRPRWPCSLCCSWSSSSCWFRVSFWPLQAVNKHVGSAAGYHQHFREITRCGALQDGATRIELVKIIWIRYLYGTLWDYVLYETQKGYITNIHQHWTIRQTWYFFLCLGFFFYSPYCSQFKEDGDEDTHIFRQTMTHRLSSAQMFDTAHIFFGNSEGIDPEARVSTGGYGRHMGGFHSHGGTTMSDVYFLFFSGKSSFEMDVLGPYDLGHLRWERDSIWWRLWNSWVWDQQYFGFTLDLNDLASGFNVATFSPSHRKGDSTLPCLSAGG